MPFVKYTDPDEKKSKYVHERRDTHEEIRERMNDLNNRGNMRSFDMDQISKVWDSIINRIMGRK